MQRMVSQSNDLHAIMNFEDNVFSGPCRVEERGVVMITANGGSVQGIGVSFTLAERGEGARVRLRHSGGLFNK